MEFIESGNNKFFKKIKKLKRKKQMNEEKLFLVEGYKFLDVSHPPKYMVLCEDEETKYNNIIDKFSCKKYIFKHTLFSKISTQENSQGVLLVYNYLDMDLNNIKDNSNIVVLDRIQDPGNLGTIIRTVDAVGFKNIILTIGTTFIYNNKCVRSSMGSLFNLKINYMTENNLIKFLKENSYNIISSGLIKNSIDYKDIKLNAKNALIVGNEGQGISKNILNVSDDIVKIPIYGNAESLNVGVATGILLYKIRDILDENRGFNNEIR